MPAVQRWKAAKGGGWQQHPAGQRTIVCENASTREAGVMLHTAYGLQADSATVLRDGRLAVVPAAQLVPGDIVEVSVGGNVPADLRVAERLSATLRWGPKASSA